jgi:hypothetical protein
MARTIDRASTSDSRPVCLVLMPMYAGFEEIRAAVARTVQDAGFEMCRLEVEIQDSAWHLWLMASAAAADIVLVDLTGHNPFVMYELGYVHHRQLPTAFIVNARDKQIPATVRGAVCTAYGGDSADFEAALAYHLRELWHRRTAIDAAAHAVAESDLYLAAVTAAEEFTRATGMTCSRVDDEEFRARLTVIQRRGDPAAACFAGPGRARYLLSLLFEHSDRVEIMRAVGDWTHARMRRAMAAG